MPTVFKLKVKQGCVDDSRTTLRNVLLPHDWARVSMQCKDGSTVHVKKSVEPEPEQKKRYAIPGVTCHPGNSVKNDNCGKITRCSNRVEGGRW